MHGSDAYKQSVLGLLNPCPDFHATVEDLIGAEGDTVVTRLIYRGTDTGGFVRGHAATGKPFEFGAIYIWRLSNGKFGGVVARSRSSPANAAAQDPVYLRKS